MKSYVKVNRAGDDNYAETSIQQSGSVMPFEKSATEPLLKPVTVGTFPGFTSAAESSCCLPSCCDDQFNASTRRRHHK